MNDKIIKHLARIESGYKDFRAFPNLVQDAMGYALYWAQAGDLHESAKPLKGFGGASVVEIVEYHATDTYRAVYTLLLAGVVYVLHAFQKKATTAPTSPDEQGLASRCPK